MGCLSPWWSAIEIPQLHAKPLQCLPQEEGPLRLMKVLILHNRCCRFSRRAVGKKWALKQVGSHSASTLESERADWWGLMRLRGKQEIQEGNIQDFESINKLHVVFWLVITHRSLYQLLGYCRSMKRLLERGTNTHLCCSFPLRYNKPRLGMFGQRMGKPRSDFGQYMLVIMSHWLMLKTDLQSDAVCITVILFAISGVAVCFVPDLNFASRMLLMALKEIFVNVQWGE